MEYSHEVVVSGLYIPWGFVFLPDNSILVTEKSGKLIHFKDGEKTYINGLPNIEALGQGGLLDIKLHPNYKTNIEKVLTLLLPSSYNYKWNIGV